MDMDRRSVVFSVRRRTPMCPLGLFANPTTGIGVWGFPILVFACNQIEPYEF
jgi:hypothetical protein